MKILITPELSEETGQIVFQWSVMRGAELLGGGYCATESEARSDAQSFAEELK